MVRIQKKFIVFLTFIHFLELSCHSDAINKYYRSRENKILKTKMDEDRWIYKRDSINLSLMILSLIMTIIITDFLKKYGINFLQDTHISFVFGIIIGVIFNTMPHTTDIANSPSVVINRTEKHDSLNLHLLLFSSDDKESRTYVYDYSGILSDAVRDERILTIKPRSFFSYILTPIIYATALEIHGDEFLHFMPVITVFAFLGSIMSIICSSLMIYCCSPIIKLSLANFQLKHSLAFSVFTSCTDPVSIIPLLSGLGFDNIIYYSLFGESALNDAVCLVADDILKEVLINDVMFFSFITQFCILFIIKLFSSVLLGSIFGCLTSFTLKKLAIENNSLMELSIFLLFAFLATNVSNSLNVISIVTLIFCGIVQSRYALKNLSSQSLSSLNNFVSVIKYIMENIVFLQIGLILLTSDTLEWNFSFILLANASMVIARIIIVYSLTYGFNKFTAYHFENHAKIILILGGLRGGISYALAVNYNDSKEQRAILTAVLVAIILPILICALPLPLFMNKFFDININKSEKEDDRKKIEPIHNSNTAWFFSWCSHIEQKYMIPLLIRDDRINRPKMLMDSVNDFLIDGKNKNIMVDEP